jgi:hypothetical protein
VFRLPATGLLCPETGERASPGHGCAGRSPAGL